jgi:hypothetical protein
MQGVNPMAEVKVMLERPTGYYRMVGCTIAATTFLTVCAYGLPVQQTADRLSIVLTLLFTLIAAQFLMQESMPIVPYSTKFDRYLTWCTNYMVLQCAGISVIGFLVWWYELKQGQELYRQVCLADAALGAVLTLVFLVYHAGVDHFFKKTDREHEDLYVAEGDNGKLRVSYVPQLLAAGLPMGLQFKPSLDYHCRKRRFLREMYCGSRCNFDPKQFVDPAVMEVCLRYDAAQAEIASTSSVCEGLLMRRTPVRVRLALPVDSSAPMGSLENQRVVAQGEETAEAFAGMLKATGHGYVDKWLDHNDYVCVACPLVTLPKESDKGAKGADANANVDGRGRAPTTAYHGADHDGLRQRDALALSNRVVV